MRGPVLALSAAVLCLGLSACGDKPQTATARKGDAAPSQGGTSQSVAQGWKAGDATSWDTHIKTRTQGQNEYARTGAN
jgi:hypothetical protein